MTKYLSLDVVCSMFNLGLQTGLWELTGRILSHKVGT